MKTVQDLVDGLNEIYATQGKYFIEYESCTVTSVLYYIRNDIRHSLAMLKPRYRTWSLCPSIGFQGIEAQHAIIDYLTNSNPEDWFAEKKYNIIIGEDMRTERYRYKTAYRKTPKGIEVWDSAKEGDFTSDRYIFTESEIEQLKVRLPENMAKIIDLGKVEVKDD